MYNEIVHTIMNPGVIAPSHIPRMKRTANRPPKLSQAVWHNKAMDQIKILMLAYRSASRQFRQLPNKPHPFPDRPSLEGQVLWVFENEVRERKDRAKPVELICRKVV